MKKYSNIIKICTLWCAVILVFVLVLPTLPYPIYSDDDSTLQRQVITLWHIESFEGGISSRRDWLLKRAQQWEKANKGSYILINTYTPQQAMDLLNSGERFDLISFSSGMGSSLISQLLPLDTANAWGKYIESSTIEGNILAMPYMTGAYMLFSRQDVTGVMDSQTLVSSCLDFDITKRIGKNTVKLLSLDCGFGAYNNPLNALYYGGARGSVTPQYNLTQYNAYERFVSGTKSVVLLGTQRDLYRLSNRQNQGKISQLNYVPLAQYTDLVQYMGINSQSQCANQAKSFVNSLLTKEAQYSLANIGMFSVAYNDIYSSEIYSAVQSALQSSIVANVFRDQSTIDTERQQAIDNLQKN